MEIKRRDTDPGRHPATSDKDLSRRKFLGRLLLAGAAAPFLASSTAAHSAAGPSATGAATTITAECPDVELTEDELKNRKALQYVDASLHEDKHCANCKLFKAPADDAVCGGCQVVPGPIHPKGYCIAWSAVTG